MSHKVLPEEDEITEVTGRSLKDWAKVIDEAGVDRNRFGDIVNWLLDEYHLQHFYANAIAHWLLEQK